jgi:hypothetical protein
VIDKIVSGGQTGADRAGLDWVIKTGIPHGGWCPKGRKAEDGAIPLRYNLQETSTANYLQRTEQNVIDSDGTVIFSIKPELIGGSKRTLDFAMKHKKPVLLICAIASDPVKMLRDFVTGFGITTLNVAGPRASSEPTIAKFVTKVLEEACPT